MRAAGGAFNLCSIHPHTCVNFRFYIRMIGRIPEAGPTGATVKFCIAFEEPRPAHDTYIHAGLMIIRVFATKRRLGAFEEADIVLLRREFFFHVIQFCFVHRHGIFVS